MAFKISYEDESEIILETNDEGKWKHIGTPTVDVFVGYDGENTVTIQYSLMQDSSADILVTHSQCDCDMTIKHVKIRSATEAKITATINQMIKELLNF
jgi:hypothetical protein